MAEGARILSLDAIRSFRVALWKYAEAATQALGDAEGELNRTLVWLETEQQSYWQHQIRKRQETLIRAKEALRQKQMYKDASGRTPSAIEEEKAVRMAQRRLDEAVERYNNTRQWARRMQKELQNYKGGVQRLATALSAEVPAAVGQLDRLIAAVENYIALAAPDVDIASLSLSEIMSMARPPQEEAPPAEQADAPQADAASSDAAPPEETAPDESGNR